MKKRCFIILVLLIVLVLTPAFAWAENAQEDATGAESYSGDLGGSVYWSFDNGILTIFGEGKMSNRVASEILTSQKEADYSVKENGELKSYHIRSPFRDPMNGGPDISKKIRRVVIRKGVTTVADRLFVGLTNLQEVRMSDSITRIGQRAFQNCRSLQKIRFPKTCSLGIYSFAGCASLRGDIYLPDCGDITEAAFKGCTGIVNIYVSPFTHSFAYKTFEGCTSLKTVQGAYNVTSISNKAFYGCTSLRSISFGKVPKIRANAFRKCNSLKEVHYTGTTKQFKNIKFYKGNKSLSRAKLFTDHVSKVAAKRTVSRDYNKILIEWENSCHADGYQVYYATKKNGPFKRLSAKIIKRNYGKNSGVIHRNAAFDKTYYYKIRAYKTVNGKKRYGDYSAVVSGKASMHKVKKARAVKTANKATIQWEVVNGADGYCFSYKSGETSWTEIDVSGKNKYVLKNMEPGNYNYKITAYRIKKNKPVYGPESKIYSIWID